MTLAPSSLDDLLAVHRRKDHMDRMFGSAVDMSDFAPCGRSNERIRTRREVRDEECRCMFFQIGRCNVQYILIVELNLEEGFEQFLIYPHSSDSQSSCARDDID